MDTSAWLPLNANSSTLAEARVQAHYAAQWLARAARAYVPPKPDDSHTNLRWDREFGGFVTHAVTGHAYLGLRISDLTLAFFNGRPEYFPMDRQRDSDARSWLFARLGAIGLDVAKLDKPLPYEIPPHALADKAAYGVAALRPALADLSACFANADSSLNKIHAAYEGKFTASPVRCWPHHFDIATLISLDKDGGEYARSVGAGLSPGDDSYNEPYFYVTPWPYPDAEKLPAAPVPGHWHVKGFTALVLPVSKNAGQEATDSFLRDAVTASLKLLA